MKKKPNLKRDMYKSLSKNNKSNYIYGLYIRGLVKRKPVFVDYGR